MLATESSCVVQHETVGSLNVNNGSFYKVVSTEGTLGLRCVRDLSTPGALSNISMRGR
jgi:hypothetical protein